MRWPFRRVNEEDLEDEIQAHLELEVKQRLEAGELPEKARAAARRAFGSIALSKEVTRSMTASVWIESLVQDFKYALRTMRKTPAFTAIAILTLALGIGANTAIFSVVEAALLRPLPFPGSDRLVRIWATKGGARIGGASPMDMRDFDAAAQNFEGLVSYDHWRKNVSGIQGNTDPEELVVGLVPGRYFDLLRIRPILGRVFTPREDEIGNHFVAVISNAFWRTHYSSDPAVIGRTLRINGESYAIVGVIPDSIPAWMDGTSVPIPIWTPFALPDLWTEAARNSRGGFGTLGRIKPGISVAAANAEIAGLAARLARDHPMDQGIGAAVEPLADTRSGPLRPVLVMLSGAVGMVLIIACANLAGLLMARNSARYREFAVRAALGAARGRLVRQILLETLVLSLAGGAAGLGLAGAAGIFMSRMNSGGNIPYAGAASSLPLFWHAAPEPAVLFFTLGVSIFTAIIFGIGPAFNGSRISLAETLREAGRGASAGAGRQGFRRAMVVAEVALSLVLIVGAALLVQSIVRLHHQNPGFRTDHLLTAHLFVPPARYPDAAGRARFCEEFARRVRALPGVVEDTLTSVYPTSMGWTQMLRIDGRPVSRLSDVPRTRFGVIDQHFVRTLGLTVVSGRDFDDSDRPQSPAVAIVNQEFVRRYYPGENALGRQFRIGPPPALSGQPDDSESGRPVTIVGVIANFMNEQLGAPPSPEVLTLFQQQPQFNYGFKDIVVRTAEPPEGVAPAVARELRSLDPDIPLGEIGTMDERMAYQTLDTRLTTILLSLFAVLGTLLAVIGVYGVVSYLVAQRTQELGVRMALGAGAREILWLVLRHGVWLGVSGVALGIAGAALARDILAGLLYGVSPSDLWTLSGGAALLLAVVLAASVVPARRALRIDPVLALRGE